MVCQSPEGGSCGVQLYGGVLVGAAAAGADAVSRGGVAVVVPVVRGRLTNNKYTKTNTQSNEANTQTMNHV